MSDSLHKICDLINNKENIKNEEEFKLASATLICNVVHNVIDADKKQQKKYCKLFQDKLNIPVKELNKIKNNLELNKSTVNAKIEYIRNELNNSKYEIMEFLKILNRFVVLDGCSQESYREFEIIRDEFLKEIY